MKWEENGTGWQTCRAAFLVMNVWQNAQGKFCWDVKCSGFVLATGLGLDREIAKGAAEVALVDLTQQLTLAAVS